MTPEPYFILICEISLGEMEPRAVCTNSYVALAWLQRLAKSRNLPLKTIHSNKHYSMGEDHYSFDEVPMFNMAWLRKQEANQ